MDIAPTHEGLQPATISKLNILIHPLWATEPYHKNAARFDSERKGMAKNMLRRMSPQSESEVTIMLPNIIEANHHASLRKSIASARKSSQFSQWPDLYRDLVAKNGHGRNILLGTNIVKNDMDRSVKPSALLDDLREKGYQIDNNTEIIVGGEMLNACLRNGITSIFELPQIKKIKVDMTCVLSSGYLFDSHPSLEESDRKMFEKQINDSGLDITKDGDYYLIQRKS